MIKQTFEKPPCIKMIYNIGCLMDIPTGFFIRGARGENVLLGGLSSITAIVGRGNRYKTTLLNYMMLSAADKIISTTDTTIGTYDTEINVHEEGVKRLITKFEYLKDKNIVANGIWTITDKTMYYANKWYEELKNYLLLKDKDRNKLLSETPFFDRDGKTRLKVLTPTFGAIDSFTEFETDDENSIQVSSELGQKEANILHMRTGFNRARFLMTLPALVNRYSHFLLLTAHLGDEITISKGPFSPKPVKKLQHMGAGDKIKGVSDKFFFLIQNCWYIKNSSKFLNASTKSAEYPRVPGEEFLNDVDLNILTIVSLRGKASSSGRSLNIIVSQAEGVLASLSEFHFIKENERFGLSGTNRDYHLDLLPDVNLKRTTVRSIIDTDAKLRRAINITSELLQMINYKREYKDLYCEPKELYDDIKKLGYDWDMILTKTRGWFTLNDENHPLKPLSILDLLEIRAGKLTPFWYKEIK